MRLKFNPYRSDIFVMGKTNTNGVMTRFQPVQAVGQMLVELFEFDAWVGSSFFAFNVHSMG